MISILQSTWTVALLGGLLYLGTTALLLKPSHFQGVRPPAQGIKVAPDDDPSWRFRNPEFDQLTEELRREKETVALREQQLQELQTRLEAERQELLAVTQAVHQLQVEFDRNVIRFQQQEAENLKRQIKVVTGMSPEGAAGLITGMPDDEAVKLLSLMKADEASPILEAIAKSGSAGAKRAAALTEKMLRVLPAAPGANKSPRAS